MAWHGTVIPVEKNTGITGEQANFTAVKIQAKIVILQEIQYSGSTGGRAMPVLISTTLLHIF